jgi:DNA-binding Lrp family transcriptional regulator
LAGFPDRDWRWVEMAKAYLKIDVAAGKERNVKGALLKVNGVKSADLTSGEQDIIALIEAPGYEQALNLVLEKVRKINGITRTITNLVLD